MFVILKWYYIFKLFNFCVILSCLFGYKWEYVFYVVLVFLCFKCLVIVNIFIFIFINKDVWECFKLCILIFFILDSL